MSTDVWTIVLAGGAGRRLASVTGGVPKQFWRPRGTMPSLLDATLERLFRVNVPERTVSVVDAAHRQYLPPAPTAPFARVIYQPTDRGTAAGVLLPLMFVLEREPQAIVILTPADHAFDDQEVFEQGIVRGISRIRSGLSDIVLFGSEPHSVSADLGWITATTPRGHFREFQLVADFVEKPAPGDALQLFADGSVWNTMVLVANGRALAKHFQDHLPLHMDVMTAAMALDDAAREQFLADWYPELPRADFSRDVIAEARPLSLYTWPMEAGWSDLGTPERMEEWLAPAGSFE